MRCAFLDTSYLHTFPTPLQMLSDERLAKIERLVSKSLNEGTSPQKVSTSDLAQAKSISSAPDWNCRRQCSCVCREGYRLIIRVRTALTHSRRIAIPFLTSLAGHTRRTLGTFMRCTKVSKRRMNYLYNLCTRSPAFYSPSRKRILKRVSYPGASSINQCKREDGCLPAWNL
jgi:hypothetical protein